VTRCLLLLALGFAAASCADTLPPVIVEVTQLPDTTDTVGPYTVTAVVRDDRGVEEVTLYYTAGAEAAPTFKAVAMTLVQGDLYTGDIAGYPAGANVKYFVEAKDTSASYTRSPGGDGAFYQFSVRAP
jgi:hypothetical protein